MPMSEETAQLYDRSAPHWSRQAPLLLSDFTARPFLLSLSEPLAGARVLDLGCGEGYVTRQLKQRGAVHVEGLDISAQMIDNARTSEATERLGIEYHVGSAVELSRFPDASFDLVTAVFLFNYVTIEDMTSIMRQVVRVLRPAGRFIFSVPHPALPFLREREYPFYFDHEGAGYFSGRDELFEGRIWRRDGVDVPVRCVHKTFSDYFRALRAAGFTALPELHELHVQPEHLALDPAFFGPLKDVPLHVAVAIERAGAR